MRKFATKNDLENFVTERIPESLTLEYKRSPALSRDSSARDELCKDVSAFANSAGGQIIYGVEDDKNLPTKVDDGADPVITKEWIEQVIDTRIQPRIEGLIITPIALATGFGFVITIPQATSRAPHQAPDKKYYKRQNFQSSPMDDYEIRDILRRATTPALQIKLAFAAGHSVHPQYAPQEETSKPIPIKVIVTNSSPQPAFHTMIYVGVDESLAVASTDSFRGCEPPIGYSDKGNAKQWLARIVTSPPDPPIFREAIQSPLAFFIAVAGKSLRSTYFDIVTVIQTPGFSATNYWAISTSHGRLMIHGPDDPNWMPRE